MIKKLILFGIILLALSIVINHAVESGKVDNFLSKYPGLFIAPYVEYALGKYYTVLNKEKAITRFENIVKRYPNSKLVPQALHDLARIYEEKGEIPKAKQIYETFMKQHKNHKLAQVIEKKLRHYK